YCDQDREGNIDTGDTPIPGIDIKITSQTAQPGQAFTQTTDGSGSYDIALPARTDDYKVEITGLPGGFTIVIPAVLNVAGNVVIGTASHFGPNGGTAPVSVNASPWTARRHRGLRICEPCSLPGRWSRGGAGSLHRCMPRAAA